MSSWCFIWVPHPIPAGLVPALGSLPSPTALTSVALMSQQVPIVPSQPAPMSTVAHLPAISHTSPSGPGQYAHVSMPCSMLSHPVSLNQDMAPLGAGNVSGVILSSALQPIPARLVRRIVSGEFVEMRELLSDNLALHDQLEAVHGPLLSMSTPGSLRARMREVPSLTSWVYCFAAYMAVRTTDPLTRDMLAYCRLIIREALRHGGSGWQDYDRSFRSQAAIDHSLRWNSLLPGLQAATILGQRAGSGVFCTLCRGVDHTAAQCALAYMQQPLTASQPYVTSSGTQGGGHRWAQSRTRGGRPLSHICYSWNTGICTFPGTCTYRHVCANCQRPHRARDCPDTPEGSHFKPGGRTPASSAASTTRR